MEDYFDRRQREKAEAREAEEKKKAREARRHAETIPVIQARAAGTQAAWVEYIDRRISQRMAEGTIPIPEDLLKAIGEEIGETRAKQRIETKAAIEKAKGELAATFSAQLKAMEERLATRSDKRIAEHAVQTTDRINQQWDAIAKERQEWRSEIKSVVDAAQRSFEGGINTHFAAMEQRVVHQTDGRINEHIAQTAELTSTLWNMIVTECSDRQKEIKAAVEEVQRAVETKQAAKLEALEQRSVQHTDQRITQHIEQCTERTRALRDVIATESWDRQKEIKAAGEEAHRAVETKLEALEQRLKAVPQAEQQANNQRWIAIDQRIGHLEQEMGGRLGPSALHEAQCAIAAKLERKLEASDQRRNVNDDQRWIAIEERIRRLEQEMDGHAVARYVGEQIEAPLHEFVRAEVQETQCAVESKLESKLDALEQRLKAVPQAEQQANNRRWTAIDQRIKHLEDMDSRLDPSALHETQCAIESKFESNLEQLEQRLKATPGKLPVAKVWCPESVIYQAEFVTHDGALWQARKDTAQPPGGPDWICVARAGRDAITPTVRGTYSVDENYRELDIVAMDGGAFIARRDNPGVCPGDDWQLLCKQGKKGRQGATGPRGERGEKGERGEDGATTVSWQLDRERYRMSPLMSNGTVGPNQEFRGMFEQFLIDMGYYG